MGARMPHEPLCLCLRILWMKEHGGDNRHLKSDKRIKSQWTEGEPQGLAIENEHSRSQGFRTHLCISQKDATTRTMKPPTLPITVPTRAPV